MKSTVSLKPTSTQPKDVLKHVFFCLGKDTIPFQELVFFMAFDLKLFPPSECEKTLDAARKEGFIDIAADKMVTIHSRLLTQAQRPAGKAVPMTEIVNALASNLAEIDKAVAIKPNRLLSCGVDGKTGVITATFSGEVQGKVLSVVIDPVKKSLHQDYDDDVSTFSGKRVLLKFALRAAMLRKDDPPTIDAFRDVLATVAGWKFTFKRV